MAALFREIPPGGIMFFRYNLNTNSNTIRSFLSQASSLINEHAGIRPFMAVDHEGGTVNRFPRGIAALPEAAFYWRLSLEEGVEAALAKLEEDTFKAASEIFALGFNMNFAPIAEYLIDENRVFLRSRSYGPDPVFTALAASAFMRNMEKAGVLCVVKHFPGSAGRDPHYFKSELNIDKAALDMLVSPFTALINEGARSIMAAHTSVPVIDSEIASLSKIFMEDYLRGELGFKGLIISDDFAMEAAGNLKHEEAAVRSIAAGSDMILVWQLHLRQTHQAIIMALQDGSLSRERLIEAAERVVYEKLRMGLWSGIN
jgi:beta-N-acetylhexosaminidase